jgi:hypothetical protein
MKTSLIKLSSSIILICLSFPLMAKPLAQVLNITGQVFMVTADGKTSLLKLNDHLEDKTEILVEEGASVTLGDFYDATYELTGGSHLKLFNRSVQLKKGKTWIQAKNDRHPLAVTTANGHIDFSKSEFITTFDHATNKTQILVVSGELAVSNLLDKSLRVSIPGGAFSYIDPEIEGGTPRSPMRVGPLSWESSVSDFRKKGDLPASESTPKREIASVKEVNKGEIIFISSALSARRPASVISKKSKPQWRTGVPVKYLGFESRGTPQKGLMPRGPASLAPMIKEKLHMQKITEIKKDPDFTESLRRHEDEQPLNTKEVQSLIDELKSY